MNFSFKNFLLEKIVILLNFDIMKCCFSYVKHCGGFYWGLIILFWIRRIVKMLCIIRVTFFFISYMID